MRNWWNIIDFVIVLSGIFELFSFGLNLKSLRILRVLRPLKSINAIKSMKRLIQTLLKSMPALVNVTIFLTFILMLFSILGLQMFGGAVYAKCRLTV